MDYERALISKAVHSAQVEAAIFEGVDSTWFTDESLRMVWDHVVGHYRTYGVSPSFESVASRFPKVNIPIFTDSMQFVLDGLRSKKKRRRVTQALEEMVAIIKEGDPKVMDQVDLVFLDQARKVIQDLPGGDMARFSDMDRRIASYRNRLTSGMSPVGIRIGIPQIDQETYGIQPHEFVTISGYSGTGKSTLLQYALLSAYWQGKDVMMFSMEVDTDAVMRKWDAMTTKMTYRNLKGLSLSDEELATWESAAKKAKERKNDLIAPCDVRDCTVDRLYAEIIRNQPDIVGIDYITLLKLPSNKKQRWEQVTELSRELKQLAHSLKVPIIAIAQGNRDSRSGGELDNVSYQSIVQDSDIVITLRRTEEMVANQQMEVRLRKNRDGKETAVLMKWDLEHMDIDQWVNATFTTTVPSEQDAEAA